MRRRRRKRKHNPSGFWDWASKHWFLTFLLAGSAISAAVVVVRGYEPPPPKPTPFPPVGPLPMWTDSAGVIHYGNPPTDPNDPFAQFPLLPAP